MPVARHARQHADPRSTPEMWCCWVMPIGEATSSHWRPCAARRALALLWKEHRDGRSPTRALWQATQAHDAHLAACMPVTLGSTRSTIPWRSRLLARFWSRTTRCLELQPVTSSRESSQHSNAATRVAHGRTHSKCSGSERGFQGRPAKRNSPPVRHKSS